MTSFGNYSRLQSYGWAQYHRTLGRQSYRWIGLDEDDVAVAMMPGYVRRDPFIAGDQAYLLWSRLIDARTGLTSIKDAA